MDEVKQPMQPVYMDEHGTLRFRENLLVRMLLNHGRDTGFGLNEIALVEASVEDRRQLAQLIGYSLSGYGDLSYVDDASYKVAEITYHEGKDERDARIKHLEYVIATLKAQLREPMEMLFERSLEDEQF